MVQLESVFVSCPCLVVFGLPVRQPRECGQTRGPGRRRRFSARQQGLQPLLSLGQLPGALPEAPEAAGQAQTEVWVVGIQGVAKSSTKIVDLGRQSLRSDSSRLMGELWFDALCQAAEIISMTDCGLLLLSGRGQLF